MSASRLAIVPDISPRPANADSLSDRIRRLREEARGLAHEQVEQLQQTLFEAARLAAEIAEGGDVFPVGVREIARRLAEDTPHQAMTLGVLVERDRAH